MKYVGLVLEAESGMVVSSAWEIWEIELLFNGYRVSALQDEKFLEIGMYLLLNLKWLRWYTLCVFYHSKNSFGKKPKGIRGWGKMEVRWESPGPGLDMG